MGVKEEDIVLKLIEAFAKDWPTEEELDEALSVLADDAYYQMNVPISEPIRGRDAIRAEIHRQMKTDAQSQRHTMRVLVSNDNVVFTERSDEASINGNGRYYTWIQAPLIGVWEVENTKIVAWREYWDSLNVARQFGIEPQDFYTITEGSPFGNEAFGEPVDHQSFPEQTWRFGW
jgi:limonene-1,2-epoxide hydrolase